MIQEKLRNIRREKGMSQEKIAKLLCTDTSNYSRKERGEINIREDEWEKIADILGVFVEDIKTPTKKKTIKKENAVFNDNYANYDQNYPFAESIIKNLQDFINHLQAENRQLKEKLENIEERFLI